MKVLDISLFKRPTIQTNQSIGIRSFGVTLDDQIHQVGEADNVMQIFGLELVYGDTVIRLINNHFVECTFPHPGLVKINELTVINVFQWLSGFEDTLDRARFRVCPNQSIACPGDLTMCKV